MNTIISIPRHSSIPRFAKKNGAVFFQSRDGIELGDLERIAPSVFAEGAHDSRSQRYTHIPTRDVLMALDKEGFVPYSVMQGGSKDEGKRGFTKHLLRFRHASLGAALGAQHHEVCLLNSHDGTSAYKLFSGVFRMVCSNGLVVSEGEIEEVRVPHKGDVVGQVVDGFFRVLGSTNMLTERVREFESVQLTRGQRQAFAAAALSAKYDDESPITIEQVLSPRRREDAAPTLWNTFNVLQENLVRGGLHYNQRDDRGRVVAHRQTRPVQGIDGNTALNRALWTLTSKMSELLAA